MSLLLLSGGVRAGNLTPLSPGGGRGVGGEGGEAMSRDSNRTQRARQLTPAESILWKEVRGRRFAGFKFRRQHPIGPFFADLACHECKLIVELDGETHLGAATRDEERTKYLQSHGWLVLRFWNTQVYEEREAVREAIYRACQQRLQPLPAPLPPHPPTPLPPPGGEGSKTGPPDPLPLSPEAGEKSKTDAISGQRITPCLTRRGSLP